LTFIYLFENKQQRSIVDTNMLDNTESRIKTSTVQVLEREHK